MRVLTALLAMAVGLAAATTTSPTFTKEVLPILQSKCQDCHRPGEAAPMSFLSYKEARPWAKAIRQAVISKKMPPWFADPHYGKFANDRSLSQTEIDTIVAWVDGGVKEGDAKYAPAPRTFVQGWTIGKPDMIVEMPNAVDVPASGTVEYQYVIIPTNLKEDRWVLASEVRPGDRSVMHHVITSIREPGSKWMPDAKPGIAFVPPRGNRLGAGGLVTGLNGFVPGQALLTADPNGAYRAVLLKAGSDIVFQLHYTPTGKATTDRTKIGIIFAKEPPANRLVGGNSASFRLNIPPGGANYKVEATSTVANDCELVSMMPHAHLRGKSFEYRITRPNGETETVLKVPRYDFNWQLTYYLAKPIPLPKGSKVEVIAFFDNSPNNPFNPDATKEVHWGEQTYEEMMMGYYAVMVAQPKTDKAPAQTSGSGN